MVLPPAQSSIACKFLIANLLLLLPGWHIPSREFITVTDKERNTWVLREICPLNDKELRMGGEKERGEKKG